MNYISIYPVAISDGSGVRVSLYVAGCRNHCEGCHNRQSWDFNTGNHFTDETIDEVIKDLSPSYIKGLTLCGGEPCEEENQRALIHLLRAVKKYLPDKDIWFYTGYEWRDLIRGGKKHCEVTDELLSYVDIAVVGPFILAQRDITDNNRWRGSRNQRVIDVKSSLAEGREVFVEDMPNNK